MTLRSIVGLAGNLTSPSRTRVLVEAVLEAVQRRVDASASVIDLSVVGPVLLSAPTRDALARAGEVLLSRVEAADLVVVGTPVYRASYTGALKHVFDLLHKDSLAGKPAILAATGGSPLHGLVTEHQLRPLLTFFNAHTVPTSLYATEADFTDYRIANAALARRIERAADEAATLLALTGGTRAVDAAVLAADRQAGGAQHGNA
jgi:FMN reductase